MALASMDAAEMTGSSGQVLEAVDTRLQDVAGVGFSLVNPEGMGMGGCRAGESLEETSRRSRT